MLPLYNREVDRCKKEVLKQLLRISLLRERDRTRYVNMLACSRYYNKLLHPVKDLVQQPPVVYGLDTRSRNSNKSGSTSSGASSWGQCPIPGNDTTFSTDALRDSASTRPAGVHGSLSP